MGKKFEKAIADWPKTKLIKENGGGIHITGKYVHPGLERRVQIFWTFITVIVAGFCTVATVNPLVGAIMIILMIGIYLIVWKPAMANMFGKNLDIKLFADSIQFRQGGWRYKHYNRAMPIEFKIEQHQKALEEYQREQQSGRRMADTYRQAIEVVMQYGEMRVALCELPNTKIEMAKALVLRIQRVAGTIDMAKEMSERITPAQGGEFDPAPEMR